MIVSLEIVIGRVPAILGWAYALLGPAVDTPLHMHPYILGLSLLVCFSRGLTKSHDLDNGVHGGH